MPTSDDFIEFPVFGDNSDKEKPDDPKYAAGFLPGDVLPAEWLNWFLNTISQGYNELVGNAVGFSPDSINTITNKTIAYADNTMPGVQPTMSAGTGIDITGKTISTKQTYSTSEVKTGDVWIDGKPIYRKTYYDTTVRTGNTGNFVLMALPDLDNIVSTEGSVAVSNGAFISLPYSTSSTTYVDLYTNTSKELALTYAFSGGLTRITATAYYTKTTD